MIRITGNITYGYHKGRIVEKKTKNSPPFELDARAEKELVDKGFAEYVDEAPQEDVNLAYLRSLKMAQIKEFGESIGVKYRTGTKKEDYIQAVWEAYNPPMQSYQDEPYNPFGYPEGADE